MLGPRPSGHEFRIVCLDGSVILPSLAYNVHKGGLKSYSFIHIPAVCHQAIQCEDTNNDEDDKGRVCYECDGNGR